jgi:hypothetical protein
MHSELTVTVKDDEKKVLKKTFLLYEPYSIDESDATIKNCIEETVSEFQGTPDDIKVVITLEIE